jgi:DNA polymerase I-like protein with 3'-5' exonuclease and polymerase domains
MQKAFTDTETAGLHGVIVKIQTEFDNEGVNMIDAWLEKVSVSMALIERIVDNHVIAHNLRFDWFHLSKWYNMCRWVLENHGDVRPVDLDVEIMVEAEWQSQFGLCLKPRGATCTLLTTQQGELQTLMNRKGIVIKRQPIQLRDKLMAKLELMTAHLPDILFAKRDDPFAPRWTWTEIKEEKDGEICPDFVDIKLNFKPSNALKSIAKHVLGYEPKYTHKDIHLDNIPKEFNKMGYMPFARLAGPEMWPDVIKSHIDHWEKNEEANQYAHDDIPLLKALYEHLDEPEPDRYGLLACQIASSRLRGMEVNVEAAAEQLVIQEHTISLAPVNVDSPKQVREYIADAMDPTEALVVAKSAKAAILEDVCKVYVCEDDEECCEFGCPRCDTRHAAKIFGYDLDELRGNKPKKELDILEWEQRITDMEDHISRLLTCKLGWIPAGRMPVIARVREIQRTRKAGKRAQVYRKLIQTKGRMYPSFNPIGAKSGRLSGADGFNFQAIGSEEAMRAVFTLTDGTNVLSMGDYDSLEIIIAIVVYGDDALAKDVESGKSLHALMACEVYGLTYEQVMAKKGTKDDVYKKAKIVVYSLLYGSTIAGIANKLTLPVNVVQKAYDNFVGKYPGVAKARKELAAMFTAIAQPGGRGTEVYYQQPQMCCESMFGFKRDFSIEFELLKILYDFANDLPVEWKKMRGASIRYGDEQKAYWRHVASGLFGAAMNSIQGGVIRAALNHIIQSTGNHLTVGLQTAVWDVQPVGIKPFVLTLMSIHDEICVVSDPEVVDKVASVVYTCIESQQKDVPLLAMEWMSHASSWAGKTNKQGTKQKMGWQLDEAA